MLRDPHGGSAEVEVDQLGGGVAELLGQAEQAVPGPRPGAQHSELSAVVLLTLHKSYFKLYLVCGPVPGIDNG